MAGTAALAAGLAAWLAVDRLRASLEELGTRWPGTEFADTHSVPGRGNTGGTTVHRGIVIGLEVVRDAAQLPTLVVHETAHLNQPRHRRNITLLARAIRGGAASFLAAFVTGRPPVTEWYVWGSDHEGELWEELRTIMDGYETQGWMWGVSPEGRPDDLAYHLGYRIVQAWYARHGDAPDALETLLSVTYDERDFLEASGYAPGLPGDGVPRA